MSVLPIVAAFLGLFVTIIASAVGIAAYVTTHLTRIETDLKHAFKRIDALEEERKVTPIARRKRR